MSQLHVQAGLLLIAVVLGTQACSESQEVACGCIVTDHTILEKDDYVFHPIRTADFKDFLDRLWDALKSHWLAYSFIYSIPDDLEPPEEIGDPICPTEKKHILGYFKNYGLTLCLVVKPHLQMIKKVECCSEVPPCGVNTRCVPGGYVQKTYLVYCDALFRDENGCLIGTDHLTDTKPSGFDESHFNGGRRKRDADNDDEYANSTDTGRKKREGDCPYNEWYFAFRHDNLPSTCSARTCNCG